jgi:hypothetical protein
MLLEERKLHIGARHEETLSVHRSGKPVTTKLYRIAEKARKEPGFKFTSLYHLMNEDLLRGCFQRLRKDAAAGIDKMTKESDGVYSASCQAAVYPKAWQCQRTSLGDTKL